MPRISARLAARIERAEAASAPVSRQCGHVARSLAGETREAALRRLYPAGVPKGFGVMVVPAMVTDATREAWEEAFKAQQTALANSIDVEINELRRSAQEAGANEINPIIAAVERHRIAAKSNPYRPITRE